MPLSEQEQRLLDEMERNLYHNDAEFVANVSSRRGRPTYSAMVLGILVAVVGLGVLITGVAIHQPIVGVVGFAIMFGGVMLAITPRKGAAAPSAHRSSTFIQNLSDRWDRRETDRDQ